ncbi:MAG: protein BatD, partial [Chloroflexota bacterium]
PYQGQQVLYKVRFYQAVDGLGGLDYRPPAFTGFWSEQRPEQGEYMIRAAGRNYRVTELTSVLFPTVVGEVTIDPATLTVPGDFFSRGANLASQPLSLNVQLLPDNAPPGFTGAVGRFDIEATVDKAESKVNDTVNWRVVLSGEGNVENLPDPLWNESQNWRAFDSEASVDSRFENGIQAGSRVYERVLVPTEAGDLSLPAVSYTYFDPALGEYVTIESQPMTIHVMPDGSNPGKAATLPAGGVGAAVTAAPGSAGEIRPMKEAPASWSTGSPWLTDKAEFWLLWTIPMLLLVGHYGWQRRQSSRLNSVSQRRSKQAAGKAHRALREARKGAASDVYHACGRVMTTYLAEKLDRSLTGMTQSGVAQLLRESGVEAELADRVERCLMLSEMGRYAPADLYKAGDELIAETGSLINELDKVL